jgi:MFS family permease
VATEWWVLLIARLVAGCAGGMMATSAMVYLSEMALPQFRGALLGSFSLAFALGQMFLAIALKILEETKPMDFATSFTLNLFSLGSGSSRCSTFRTHRVSIASFACAVLDMTDTLAAWYASKGRHDEGKKALLRLVGNVKDYDVEREYAVLKYEMDESMALQKKNEGQSEWRALLTNKTNVKRAIISTLPFTFQNVVGVPLMFGYTTYFFELAGVDDPFLGNIVKQIVLVIGIILAFYTVDKVGRRTLVIYGGALMAAICLIVGGLVFMEQTSASGMALVALCSFWGVCVCKHVRSYR